MIRGNNCPNCNESILSFSEFIKITNTNKSFYCENCGKEVRLKNHFMFFILAAVIIGLALPTFLLGTGNAPDLFYNLSKTTGILAAILYILFWIGFVTYLAWKFIGWVEVHTSNN
jgi:hypothetical protein